MFDEEVTTKDLAQLSRAGVEALTAPRSEIERDGGLPASRLTGCEAEGRDGTRPADRVKTYIPWPDGRFGAVCVAVAHPERHLGLRAIASGVRHQPHGSHAPTAYELAHRRLNG